MAESNSTTAPFSKPKLNDSALPSRTKGCKSRALSLFFCFMFGIGSGIFYSEHSYSHLSSNGHGDASDIHTHITFSSDGQHANVPHPSIPHSHFKTEKEFLEPRPLLIIVTPTYARAFQAMYLTKMVNLLRLVPPPILWIVVETDKLNAETACLLRNSGLMYRHLVTKTNMTNIKDRGVHQRNAAIEHIELHRLNGVVYFADDDNVYSLELFQEIRKVKRFGVFPVGMLQQSKSKVILEGPVCESGSVIGWHTNEKSKQVRRFHVDMSGFAFNSTILWDTLTWQRPFEDPIRQLDTVKEGFQETTFISQLVPDEYAMEGLADDCSKVLVWHLHAEAPSRVWYPRCTERLGFSVTLPLKVL